MRKWAQSSGICLSVYQGEGTTSQGVNLALSEFRMLGRGPRGGQMSRVCDRSTFTIQGIRFPSWRSADGKRKVCGCPVWLLKCKWLPWVLPLILEMGNRVGIHTLTRSPSPPVAPSVLWDHCLRKGELKKAILQAHIIVLHEEKDPSMLNSGNHQKVLKRYSCVHPTLDSS